MVPTDSSENEPHTPTHDTHTSSHSTANTPPTHRCHPHQRAHNTFCRTTLHIRPSRDAPLMLDNHTLTTDRPSDALEAPDRSQHTDAPTHHRPTTRTLSNPPHHAAHSRAVEALDYARLDDTIDDNRHAHRPLPHDADDSSLRSQPSNAPAITSLTTECPPLDSTTPRHNLRYTRHAITTVPPHSATHSPAALEATDGLDHTHTHTLATHRLTRCNPSTRQNNTHATGTSTSSRIESNAHNHIDESPGRQRLSPDHDSPHHAAPSIPAHPDHARNAHHPNTTRHPRTSTSNCHHDAAPSPPTTTLPHNARDTTAHTTTNAQQRLPKRRPRTRRVRDSPTVDATDPATMRDRLQRHWQSVFPNKTTDAKLYSAMASTRSPPPSAAHDTVPQPQTGSQLWHGPTPALLHHAYSPDYWHLASGARPPRTLNDSTLICIPKSADATPDGSAGPTARCTRPLGLKNTDIEALSAIVGRAITHAASPHIPPTQRGFFTTTQPHTTRDRP